MDLIYENISSLGNVNQDKSAASFCCQVAAWVSDMFRNFHLEKNQKIAINSTTTEFREKNSTFLESIKV